MRGYLEFTVERNINQHWNFAVVLQTVAHPLKVRCIIFMPFVSFSWAMHSFWTFMTSSWHLPCSCTPGWWSFSKISTMVRAIVGMLMRKLKMALSLVTSWNLPRSHPQFRTANGYYLEMQTNTPWTPLIKQYQTYIKILHHDSTRVNTTKHHLLIELQ